MIVDITLLLAKCKQFRTEAEILVVCDTDETLFELVKKQHQLIQSLTSPGERWERIVLRSNEGGEKTTLYPPKFNQSIAIKPMVHSSILVIPEAEIISEIMKYPNPSSLVRLEDDKGIFTNSHTQKSSGTTPNNWVGAKMSSYWIPEELERYKQLLLKEKEVSNFTYAAYFFTGETAQFTVDAKLVNFNGDLCRWVRVVDCQIIS
jgi:hypothetical protein